MGLPMKGCTGWWRASRDGCHGSCRQRVATRDRRSVAEPIVADHLGEVAQSEDRRDPPDHDGAQQCDLGRLPAPPFLASFFPGLDRLKQNALGIFVPRQSNLPRWSENARMPDVHVQRRNRNQVNRPTVWRGFKFGGSQSSLSADIRGRELSDLSRSRHPHPSRQCRLKRKGNEFEVQRGPVLKVWENGGEQ